MRQKIIVSAKTYKSVKLHLILFNRKRLIQLRQPTLYKTKTFLFWNHKNISIKYSKKMDNDALCTAALQALELAETFGPKGKITMKL